AISKIEAGQRTVDSLELVRLGAALQRPIGWFVADPIPSIVSRRQGREDLVRAEDIQLEQLALDVEQLVVLGVLSPPETPAAEIGSLGEAEQVALDARERAGLAVQDPAWELATIAEKLGLYVFVLPLGGQGATQAEGSYVALERGGVALVAAAGDSGRRRFTAAHELGHHVLSDEFAPEWVVGSGSTEREKVINAFAIHFLLPRPAALDRWARYRGQEDPRDAVIRIAVEFGLSWSAACAQLQRVGCLVAPHYDRVAPVAASNVELLERGLRVRSDVDAPLVPPGYASAVIRAMRKGKVGPTRALELLHGTLDARDLPSDRPLSVESMTSEIDVLPE
ncbi:MAG TPA: ImmA/IrrE family metallo-endopeptidase, partial [Kofleriaceae bacterium]|nr:ImmA/IrrE family metallo-endopeptidase [Kofleriaceae bacterium]